MRNSAIKETAGQNCSAVFIARFTYSDARNLQRKIPEEELRRQSDRRDELYVAARFVFYV